MSQAWITVGSPENFEVLRKRKFDVTAFKSSRQKQSSEMQPGDLEVNRNQNDKDKNTQETD